MSKVVLITGCSTGIGRDLASQLAHSGYTVVATARKVETLDNLPVTLKLPLDVTQPESIRQAIDRVFQHFGRIDVLVNNAGYDQCGAIEEVSDDQIQRMYDVNVFGALRMIRVVVPYMRQSESREDNQYQLDRRQDGYPGQRYIFLDQICHGSIK